MQIGGNVKALRQMKKNRKAAFVESGVFFAWLLFTIWYVMPAGVVAIQIAALAITVLFVSLSQYLRRETPRSMGLDTKWFIQSLRRVMFFSVPAIGGMWFVGLLAGSIRVGAIAFFVIAIFYTSWALVQQYLFQAYLARRLRIFFGGRILTALAAAVMFAIIHLPALFLAGGTFVFGFIAAFIFYRRPNIYSLAICHGLLGAALYGFLPDALTGRIEGGEGLLKIPFDILQHILSI